MSSGIHISMTGIVRCLNYSDNDVVLILENSSGKQTRMVLPQYFYDDVKASKIIESTNSVQFIDIPEEHYIQNKGGTI